MNTLKITTHDKNGKLAGFQSLNTTVLNNNFCSKMRKTDSVCKSCYASTMEKRFKGLRTNINTNSELLSSSILDGHDLPFINANVFRFHSTGELINDTHFINFINIAKKNPHCFFTLWTKRKSIINKVLSTTDKPANLSLIYSISKLNVSSPILPKNFDKTFSVHTKANPSKVGINCTGKCASCMLCYSNNAVTSINEVLK